MENLTSSLEDYLEAIYLLEKKGSVRVSDIADFLGVSKPSVNRAIGNLLKHELVDHELYGDVSLTQKGRALASKVLRRHKIIKKFLTDTLGVEEDVAELDACRMEHVISVRTLQKLYQYCEANSDEKKSD